MAKENKKIPFPQANDFNKIFKLICLEDQSKIKDKNNNYSSNNYSNSLFPF